MKKSYFLLLAASGWFILSIILLTIPGTAFPKEDWLDKIWFDKWVHIGMFGIMVTLWCMSWSSVNSGTQSQKLKLNFTTIATACLAYGIIMEFIQKYFVPLRSFDFGDIVADAIGCAVGLLFVIKVSIKKN